MAGIDDIYVIWATKEIFIPRDSMLLLQSVPSEIRQLDVQALHLRLKDIEDGETGIIFLDTHQHNPTVTISGAILASVVSIINGYTVTFENGLYAVNLVGANTNLGEVTNVNFVSVRSANSAGLQDLGIILSSAYNNEVAIDVANGQAGVDAPLGTRSQPVNNFADALIIAQKNSISTLQLLQSATLVDGDFSAGYTFRGDSAVTVTLTLLDAPNIQSCTFRDLTVQGKMDGYNTFRECNILDIDYASGFIFNCALSGTITLGGNAQCSIFDSWSNFAGSAPGQYASIDMGGTGNSLALRNFAGGAEISNFAGAGAISVDMASGRVVVTNSVTAGLVTIRGVSDVIDGSSGTAVVTDLTTNKAIDDVPTEVWDYDADLHVPGSVLEFLRTKLLTFTRFLANK